MSGLKRTASSRVTRSTTLAARASPYHPAVTLFEADPAPALSPPRRAKRVKLEHDDDATERPPDLVDLVAPAASGSVAYRSGTPTRVSKSPRKPKAIPQALATPHPAPSRWREAYDGIKAMRAQIVAPVDTMGCEQAQVAETEPRTKDEVTDAAVSRLRSAVGGCLSIEAVIAADESTVAEAIAKVGFWRRKTGYIKQTAQRLRDDFDADVPKTVDELCSLPGVGPKMAFLALQIAWNLNLGIGVDVHVHRITNRLGWHRPPTKNPEETRLNLQSWLPIELHPEINHMLVGFGQTVCKPVGPRCDLCDLSTNGLCPSAQKVSVSKSRRATPWVTGPKLEIKLDEDDADLKVNIKVEPQDPVK